MSEQSLRPIGPTQSGAPHRDEVGRYDRARNNSDLAAYQRDGDAYDIDSGTYDVQELSYSSVDSYDPFDAQWRARNNVAATTTEFYRQTEYMDKRWTALADATVQRYLDLMDDHSGKVTFAMKLELEKQSLQSGASDHWEKGKALHSFEVLVQEYLEKGTTADLVADSKRFGSTTVDRNPFAAENVLRRENVEKMIAVMAAIEKQFQPPAPGKKEADVLMRSLWSGTPPDGAANRFAMQNALLLIG